MIQLFKQNKPHNNLVRKPYNINSRLVLFYTHHQYDMQYFCSYSSLFKVRSRTYPLYIWERSSSALVGQCIEFYLPFSFHSQVLTSFRLECPRKERILGSFPAIRLLKAAPKYDRLQLLKVLKLWRDEGKVTNWGFWKLIWHHANFLNVALCFLSSLQTVKKSFISTINTRGLLEYRLK